MGTLRSEQVFEQVVADLQRLYDVTRTALALRRASRLHDDPLGAGERAAVLDCAASPRPRLGARDRARRGRSGDRVRVGRRRLRCGRHALGRRDVHRTTGCMERASRACVRSGCRAATRRGDRRGAARRHCAGRPASTARVAVPDPIVREAWEPRGEFAAVERSGPGIRCNGGNRARRGRDEFRGTGADVARGTCARRGRFPGASGRRRCRGPAANRLVAAARMAVATPGERWQMRASAVHLALADAICRVAEDERARSGAAIVGLTGACSRTGCWPISRTPGWSGVVFASCCRGESRATTAA